MRIQLSDKIDNARHGRSPYGPIVMDNPTRDPSGAMWARLRIADAEFVLWVDDDRPAQWWGLIDLPTGTHLARINTKTWVLQW
jgi:hypothetical protein